MKNYITCHFMGGLGNQLFQAANAISQGIKHDRPVIFLPKSETPGQGRNTENYINNIFRNLEFRENLNEITTVTEPTFEYTGVNPVLGNTSFYGYFQSTKNWFGNENEIREIFQPDQITLDYFNNKYPQLLQPNTLSIHVRRSEYLKLSHIHPTVTIEYISEALKIIGDYSTVFIFSDDHEFVSEKLQLSNSIYVNESEDYMELWLMSMCKNNIMSNSTFSWWGSFLNKNQNKKIVTPSTWFGPNGPNARDIYEPYWFVIPTRYVENGTIKPL